MYSLNLVFSSLHVIISVASHVDHGVPLRHPWRGAVPVGGGGGGLGDPGGREVRHTPRGGGDHLEKVIIMGVVVGRGGGGDGRHGDVG